jgi:hypothetical protein
MAFSTLPAFAHASVALATLAASSRCSRICGERPWQLFQPYEHPWSVPPRPPCMLIRVEIASPRKVLAADHAPMGCDPFPRSIRIREKPRSIPEIKESDALAPVTAGSDRPRSTHEQTDQDALRISDVDRCRSSAARSLRGFRSICQ